MKITFERALEVLEAMGYELEQPEQEPVGKIVLGQYEVPYIDWTSGVKVEDGMKLYAAPVRTKDLTEDEILFSLGVVDRFEYFEDDLKKCVEDARAVIAADREKNNPLTKSNKGE